MLDATGTYAILPTQFAYSRFRVYVCDVLMHVRAASCCAHVNVQSQIPLVSPILARLFTFSGLVFILKGLLHAGIFLEGHSHAEVSYLPAMHRRQPRLSRRQTTATTW